MLITNIIQVYGRTVRWPCLGGRRWNDRLRARADIQNHTCLSIKVVQIATTTKSSFVHNCAESFNSPECSWLTCCSPQRACLSPIKDRHTSLITHQCLGQPKLAPCELRSISTRRKRNLKCRSLLLQPRRRQNHLAQMEMLLRRRICSPSLQLRTPYLRSHRLR